MNDADEWIFDPPPTFDPDFYRSRNEDLQALDEYELRDHYMKFGRMEGRVGSPFAQRRRFLELASSARSILEIGPGHKPCFTGPSVRYFDVLNTAQLQERARTHTDENSDGVPPEIDYVDPDGNIDIVRENFDIIFSSHNIEHQTNIIGHLNSVYKLVNERGAFMGIMPDRRFCFDRNIPASSLGDMVQAFRESPRRHKLADIIDQYAIPVHNDSLRHWCEQSDPELYVDMEQLKVGIQESESGRYVDVHAWRLSSFEFDVYIRALIQMEMVSFRNFIAFPTPYLSNEFCFVFWK